MIPDAAGLVDEPTYQFIAVSYLGSTSSYEEAQVEQAFNAERADQAAWCTVPAAGERWPANLVDALGRRVHRNLALRDLPLGLQSSISDAGVGFARVGGTDPEVERLEAPYRLPGFA